MIKRKRLCGRVYSLATVAVFALCGSVLHAQETTLPTTRPTRPSEPAVAAEAEQSPDIGPTRFAVLRAVDKITARVTDLEIAIGEEIRFGTLGITPFYCNKRPPEDTPEVTAFLVISDTQPGEESTVVFSGWMFASSPALSTLEHPVYDVWVINCKASAPES